MVSEADNEEFKEFEGMFEGKTEGVDVGIVDVTYEGTFCIGVDDDILTGVLEQ